MAPSRLSGSKTLRRTAAVTGVFSELLQQPPRPSQPRSGATPGLLFCPNAATTCSVYAVHIPPHTWQALTRLFVCPLRTWRSLTRVYPLRTWTRCWCRYRLCPVSSPLTEECFASNPLDFADPATSMLRFADAKHDRPYNSTMVTAGGGTGKNMQSPVAQQTIQPNHGHCRWWHPSVLAWLSRRFR